jgi:hypothetical protein
MVLRDLSSLSGWSSLVILVLFRVSNVLECFIVSVVLPA